MKLTNKEKQLVKEYAESLTNRRKIQEAKLNKSEAIMLSNKILNYLVDSGKLTASSKSKSLVDKIAEIILK